MARTIKKPKPLNNRFGESIRQTLYFVDKTVDKYLWTKHSQYKMRHYGLSAQRIKRIIRHPIRTEEAVLPGMIAAMQPAGGKNYSEIWTIYYPLKKQKNIKVVTAWRYPGKSPVHNPIPKEIMEEIRLII